VITLRRIEYIDGLRAVAVLTVLASHIALHAPNLSGPVYHAVMEGAHGVDLFFVLSGYCLAYPTLVKWRQGTVSGFGVSDFAAKRIVRIVPPFYIATFALIAVAVAARTIHHSVLDIPPKLDLLKSLFFLDEHVQLLNGSFWTLMVEFRWYFLFPIVLFVWLKSPRAFVTLGCASAILYAFTRARGLDFGTLPGFMFGIIAADIAVGARMRDDIASALKRFALPLTVIFIAVGVATETHALIPGFDGNDIVWAYQPTIVGWQFAMFFFVVAAGASSRLRGALSSPALVATGVASYAIYLVHEPIVDVIVHRVNGPVGFAVAAGVALAAGFTFWAVAERPFTTGKLRRPLLDRTHAIVEACFAFCGIPKSMRLQVVVPDAPAEVAPVFSMATAAPVISPAHSFEHT
jgi:exopolysaccharide production protein ExoZ